MGNIFGVGVSALNAAQMGLATAEHNIANANMPGFNRQEIVQTVRKAEFTGAGYIGQGVDVSTVKRLYNEFLGRQVMQEQGVSAQLNTYYAQIQQIDNMVADPNSGLTPAIQEFFGAVNNVSNNPESLPARQAMVNNANFLTARFQALNQRMMDMNESVNGQIGYSVSQINSYSKQVAALNHAIVIAQAANGQPPNDLMDQRDLLVTQLNQEVKATVVKQSNGSFSVFIGNGQPLVVDEQVYKLATRQSASDPTKMEVAYTYYNGSTTTMQQSSLQGGNLGGLLGFRDEALTNSQNALGRVAMGVAGTFNQQHQLGQDLNGALGGDFFAQPVPRVYNNSNNSLPSAIVTASVARGSDYTALTGSDYSLAYDGTNYTLTRLSDNRILVNAAALPATAVDGLTFTVAGAIAGDSFLIRPTVNGARDITPVVSDPTKIAAANPVRTNATLANLGTGKISAASVNQPNPVTPNPAHPLTDLNLQQPVTITFTSATTFDVTGTGTGLPAVGMTYTPGANISYNGWTLQISGAPVATDTFTVGSNTNATSDSSNALLLAGLQTQNTMAGVAAGTSTPQAIVNGFNFSVANATMSIDGVPITLNANDANYAAIAAELTAKMQASALGSGYSAAIVGGKLVISNALNTGPVVISAVNANAIAAGFSNSPGVGAAGTTSYQGAYSQLVSYVGNKTRELEVTSKAQASMVEQSVQAQQSYSGVNLDEEAANLLRYQRAYQAAGKALQIANTMFDTVINLGLGR